MSSAAGLSTTRKPAPAFESLPQLYAHLESSIGGYRWECEVQDLFKGLRDDAHERGDARISEQAQWEIEFWGVCLKDGRAVPTWRGSSDDGTEFAFPDIGSFEDAQLDYLETRLEDSRNPILRSRYAQLLWNTPRRNGAHATVAMDSYLKLLSAPEVLLEPSSWRKGWARDLPRVKNALAISRMSKYRTEDTRDVILALRQRQPTSEIGAFPLFRDIVRIQIEDNRLFDSKSLGGVADECFKFADAFIAQNQMDVAIDCLQLGLDVQTATSVNTKVPVIRIARLHEILVERDAQGGNWAAITHCQEAEKHYEQVGELDNAARMRQRREQLKSELPLEEIVTPVDLTPVVEKHQERAEHLCSSEPEQLLPILTSHPGMIPDLSSVERSTEEVSAHGTVMDFVGISPIDDFGNSMGDFSTDEGRRAFALSEQYRYAIQFDKAILIEEIVSVSIRREILTWPTLSAYLERNSWIGQAITRPLPSGMIENYRWLDSLSPGLKMALESLSRPTHTSEESIDAAVLCIDSLVPKIEGMVRDICRVQGAITVKHKSKHGRSVEEEIGLSELLEHPLFARHFTRDELYFFRYILCDNLGWNLRNRIAHSLMFQRHYSWEAMRMVLLVILRLAKLQFIETIDDSPAPNATGSSE